MSSKQSMSRVRVYLFFLKHRDKGKMYTVNHFMAEGISKATIYRVIKRAETDSGHERVKWSGRVAKKWHLIISSGLKSCLIRRMVYLSVKQLENSIPSSLTFTKHWNWRLLSDDTKKRKIPKRTQAQINKAKPLCSKLYRIYNKKAIILDDESYFTLSHSSINGNDGFYSSDASKACSSVKFCPTAKFEKKLLVYLVVSPKGVSIPMFRDSGSSAVYQYVYLDYIKKRFLPFIHEHHSDGEYVFWPDLTSAHNANNVTTYFEVYNINYVKRADKSVQLKIFGQFWKVWFIMVTGMLKTLTNCKIEFFICWTKLTMK